jgi:hypothetical protein
VKIPRSAGPYVRVYGKELLDEALRQSVADVKLHEAYMKLDRFS